jgi:hypothetical protein
MGAAAKRRGFEDTKRAELSTRARKRVVNACTALRGHTLMNAFADVSNATANFGRAEMFNW